MDFLLRLLLWKNVTNGGQFEGLRLPRCDTPGGAALFIALLVVGVLAIRWAYRRDVAWVTRPQKRMLTIARAGALAIILFIASGAFIEVASRFEGMGTVLVLVDRSQSMALVDKREGADLKAATDILGDAARAGKATRQDLLVAAFADAKRDPVRLLEGRFKVETYDYLSLAHGPEAAARKLRMRMRELGSLRAVAINRSTASGSLLLPRVEIARSRTRSLASLAIRPLSTSRPRRPRCGPNQPTTRRRRDSGWLGAR